jgi:hypothetical protein
MKLQYYGSINPILSRALYWLAGFCTVIDGLCVIISCGYWYPGLSQKSTGIRLWFMKRKNKKIEMAQNKVACEIYTKKKRKGYLK